MVHTELEGPLKPDVMGKKYFQVFVDGAGRDKRVRGLKTRDGATDATADYTDETGREGIHEKCINGDGARELGRFENAEEWRLAMQEEVNGLWDKGRFEKEIPPPEIEPSAMEWWNKLRRTIT